MMSISRQTVGAHHNLAEDIPTPHLSFRTVGRNLKSIAPSRFAPDSSAQLPITTIKGPSQLPPTRLSRAGGNPELMACAGAQPSSPTPPIPPFVYNTQNHPRRVQHD